MLIFGINSAYNAVLAEEGEILFKINTLRCLKRTHVQTFLVFFNLIN